MLSWSAHDAIKLRARYVFHVVTINFDNWSYADQNVIRSATKRCLELADSLRCRTIVFPALATGAARFPFEPCAEAMVGSIVDYLNGPTSLETVTITLFSGGNPDAAGINLFYERAVGASSIASGKKSLRSLIEEVRQSISSMRNQALESKFDEFYNVLSTEENSENPQDSVHVGSDGSNDLFSRTTELTAATRDVARASEWDNRNLEIKLLNTRYAGCMAQLNIKAVNLSSFEIDKAKYGGIGVPPRLETAISDVRLEIDTLEKQAHEIRQRLADLHGTQTR